MQVLLASSLDRQQLRAALDDLQAGSGSADMPTALELASASAASETDAHIVIFSDGGVTLPERVSTSAEISYVPIGQSANNQAISALSLDASTAGQELTGFVRVSNFGRNDVTRRLLLTVDGVLFSAQDLPLPFGDSVALTIPDLPTDATVLEATLEGDDALTSDDSAAAIAPVRASTTVNIVGPGNRFLATALKLLPGIDVVSLSLEDYEASAGIAEADSSAETNALTIFDTVLPSDGRYPNHPILFLAPLRSTPFFSVTGTLEAPELRPAGGGDALLRYVDVAGVAVQSANQSPLPSWGRPVIIADQANQPILTVGEHNGQRLALLSFDLRQSDLPLRVAFPLLLANLVDFLVPGTTGGVQQTVAAGTAAGGSRAAAGRGG